jgi:glycosyltransferase involved in cell wall biosynthesis
MNKILAIVPAFNEEDSIVRVINSLFQFKERLDILVINDASTDKTSELARATDKAKIIDLPYNLGVGGVIQTGFLYAKLQGYDYVFQFDGDGQHRVEEVEKILKPVFDNQADIVIGSRFCEKGNGYRSTWTRRFGIKIFEWISLFLIGKRITDCTSGFRAYNRRALEFLSENYPVDYPEPETVILLGKNRYRIIEVFTNMQGRYGGKSHITIFNSPFYMAKVSLGMLMTALRGKKLSK